MLLDNTEIMNELVVQQDRLFIGSECFKKNSKKHGKWTIILLEGSAKAKV